MAHSEQTQADIAAAHPKPHEVQALTVPEPATTAAPARRKRAAAYVARITVTVPIDMTDAETLARAIEAVKGLGKHLPAGASVKIDATVGKV